MVSVYNNILELLTEEDIQLVCKNSDVEVFLKIFRDEKDKNKYKKYTQKLGRLDKKNSVAQKLGPIFAFELYKKGDKLFSSAVAIAAENLGDKFGKLVCSDIDNKDAIAGVISAYTDDELAAVYMEVFNVWNNFSCDLFFLVLKINGVTIEDSRKNAINNIISIALKKIYEEKEISKKISDEKKKLEKELLQRFAAEKEKLLQENRILEKKYAQLEKQKEEVEHELELLRDRDEKERDHYFTERKRQVDEELKEYKKKQENQVNEDIKLKKQLSIQAISDEEEQKRKEITERFGILIETKEKELEEISKKVDDSQEAYQDSLSELERLKKEIEMLVDEQEQLKQFEEEYFRDIKKRFLQVELDRSLLEKVNPSASSIADDNLTYRGSLPIICASSFFTNDIEVSQEIIELDDFIQDFSDNISLMFDNSNEIAAMVTAAIINKKPIVIEDSLVKYIADSLSALTNTKPSFIIDVNGASKEEIIKTISSYDGKVVVVNGVLGAYDELLFDYIYRECSDKYIFMTIPNVNDIKLFSKAILNKALILDVEGDYSFLSNEPLWVGEHDIETFFEKSSHVELNKTFDKYFRNLVSEKVCSKVVAIELSKVLSSYLLIMSEIGEVLSRVIGFYIDDSVIDSEELNKILEKNGWK